jgi:hypothetical protein
MRLRSVGWVLLFVVACRGGGCKLLCSKPADDRWEPNDTVEQATPLERGVTIEARTLSGNPDVWRFDAVAGEQLEVRVCTATEPTIELSGPGGARPQVFARDEPSCPHVYPLDVVTTGAYAVSVAAKDHADAVFWGFDDYTITVRER